MVIPLVDLGISPRRELRGIKARTLERRLVRNAEDGQSAGRFRHFYPFLSFVLAITMGNYFSRSSSCILFPIVGIS